MSFKIIQEYRKKGFVLTIVPNAFEENGVFWFPPSSWSTRKRNLVAKNPLAQPDKEHWKASPCILKRKNIKTYDIALEYEEELLAKCVTADSEEEDKSSDNLSSSSLPVATQTAETDKEISRPKRILDDLQKQFKNLDFDSNFESIATACFECIDKQDNNNNICQQQDKTSKTDSFDSRDTDPLLTTIVPKTGSNNNNTVQAQNKNSRTQPSDYGDSDSLLGSTVQETRSGSETNEALTEIQNLKALITNGFAKIYTLIDTLMKTQNRIDIGKNANKQDLFVPANFEKIFNFEKAAELEKSLSNPDYLTDMVTKMSFIVGKNGQRTSDGWTCCYELVDCFFARSFLVECSWTGASTNKSDKGKIQFMSFKNILLCFYFIIANADPTFTLEDTKKFFKSLLRNSTRFSQQGNKQIRKSSQRHRAKKDKHRNEEQTVTSV